MVGGSNPLVFSTSIPLPLPPTLHSLLFRFFKLSHSFDIFMPLTLDLSRLILIWNETRTMDSLVEEGRGLGCIEMRRGDSMEGVIFSWSLPRLRLVILVPGRAMGEAAGVKIRPASSVLASWICILSILSFFLRWGLFSLPWIFDWLVLGTLLYYVCLICTRHAPFSRMRLLLMNSCCDNSKIYIYIF